MSPYITASFLYNVYMRKILIVFAFLASLVFPIKTVNAIETPTSVDNNKFGIHITDESDIEDAARLVNSSGGDWGYVTFVIREDERNVNRWQNVFDKLRRQHLIPLVRIATTQDEGNWTKPDPDDISGWVNFFESLNWVIKNRYIIIGNEANHATEWGGEVDSTGYGEFVTNISKRLKLSSPDYFVMMGGLDASAPDNKSHMSEEKFLRQLILKYPKYFENLDGWVSHSYPNPDFSAPPTNTGQKSIKTYEWELSLLRRMGVSKNLPVFVTETGWAHRTETESDYLDPEELNEYYQKLFEIYLNDSNIIAFTPFILNYSGPPFDIFSWKDNRGYYYEFFEDTQKVLKIKGSPIQITEAEIIFEIAPEFINKNNNTYAVGIVKNTGQSIWIQGITREANEKGKDRMLEIDSPLFTDIEPGKIGIILYRKI